MCEDFSVGREEQRVAQITLLQEKVFVNIWGKQHHVTKGNADFPLEVSQIQFQFSYFKPFQEVPATAKYEQLYAPNIVEIREAYLAAMDHPLERPPSFVDYRRNFWTPTPAEIGH